MARRAALTFHTVRPSIPAAALIVMLAGAVHPGAVPAEAAEEAEQPGNIDLKVSLGPAAQSGQASASVRIHADRPTVWSLLTNCANAPRLVPGLLDCAVIATAPDGSWQLIRHEIDYSWYVPRLTFVFRADYRYPAHISIRRVSGDLKVLTASWDLEADGDFTIARYSLAIEPGFWVPHWMVRAALRHDLPKMLGALRSLAESPH
jgi:hypothetical protein